LNFLESLSQTALVRWTAESDWGYPIVLTSHAIGMALVVGILLMLDLRVLGLGNKMSFDSLRIYFRVAWVGLIVNAISGTLLFLANYTAFLHNTAFLAKISLLAIGGLATWSLVREISSSSPDQPSRRARIIASMCIAIWLGAIVAGRIVGYTSVPE
jgi:hypothetical protein